MSDGAQIDYAALAKQAGAISSQPAGVDYAALAKQAGALSSQPAINLRTGAGMEQPVAPMPKVDMQPAEVGPAGAYSPENMQRFAKIAGPALGAVVAPELLPAGAGLLATAAATGAGTGAGTMAGQAVAGQNPLEKPQLQETATSAAIGAAGSAILGGVAKVLPNISRAGKLFDEVRTAASGQPVEVTDAMSQAASRAQELANTGAKGMPRVISKFIARVTDPDKAPIAWDEARDFYSNVSRLSSNEYQSMNPQMSAAVGRFAGAFDDSLRAAAEAAGKGDEYSQAMQLYRTSKSWQQFGGNVWQGVKSALPAVGGAGVGAALGYKAAKSLADLF